jgi:hypothetical protein
VSAARAWLLQHATAGGATDTTSAEQGDSAKVGKLGDGEVEADEDGDLAALMAEAEGLDASGTSRLN